MKRSVRSWRPWIRWVMRSNGCLWIGFIKLDTTRLHTKSLLLYLKYLLYSSQTKYLKTYAILYNFELPSAFFKIDFLNVKRNVIVWNEFVHSQAVLIVNPYFIYNNNSFLHFLMICINHFTYFLYAYHLPLYIYVYHLMNLSSTTNNSYFYKSSSANIHISLGLNIRIRFVSANMYCLCDK